MQSSYSLQSLVLEVGEEKFIHEDRNADELS